jgi:hypothetical protein
MVLKSIIVLGLVISLLGLINTTHAQVVHDKAFFDAQNGNMTQAVQGCTLAHLIPINISATIQCDDVIKKYNDRACFDPELAPNIQVCKYGILNDYLSKYGPARTILSSCSTGAAIDNSSHRCDSAYNTLLDFCLKNSSNNPQSACKFFN